MVNDVYLGHNSLLTFGVYFYKYGSYHLKLVLSSPILFETPHVPVIVKVGCGRGFEGLELEPTPISVSVQGSRFVREAEC
jgi:hypothetical protein